MGHLLDQFVSMKTLTHKQLAEIVNHMDGKPPKFVNSEPIRDWARYYAERKTGQRNPVLFRAALKIKGEDKKKGKRGE